MVNDGTMGETMRGPMRVNNAIDPLSTIGGKAAVPISAEGALFYLLFACFSEIQA